jgi:kynurenine formamidase
MKKRFIDLSLTLEESASERISPKITYFDHNFGANQMAEIFSVSKEVFPDQKGWAGEEVTLITHAGTHMDAPWHYAPVSGNNRAKYIDEIPLEWCFGSGIVLDMRHKSDGEEITITDLQTALGKINHQLTEGEIVLIMTGADAFWGDSSYPEKGSGLGRESTLWLVAHGIKIIGIDAWGFDRPFGAIIKDFKQNGKSDIIWAAHFAGREREYCQLEKLTNLHLLPPKNFTVMCFPIKVASASAGWTRAVAMIEE